MIKNVILVDVDHTISDARWRDSMLEGADRWSGWDAYHEASRDDPPVAPIVALVSAMRCQGYRVVGFTSRPEKWRGLTMKWIVKNLVGLDDLLMRPDDSFRPAVELKMELAREAFGEKLDKVAFVVDDREDVCAAFLAVGVTSLQVMVGSCPRKN